MNFTTMLLFAQTTPRAEFEFARINAPSDWIVPVLVFCLVAAVVSWIYRRDAVELLPRRPTAADIDRAYALLLQEQAASPSR